MAHSPYIVRVRWRIERMETRGQSSFKLKLKAFFTAFGSFAFLVASLMVASSARDYQLSGRLMPNGKGGFMSFRDGYLIALALLGCSIVWFMCARRYWRLKKDLPLNGP
jgi:hypothetical protein